MIKLLIDAGAQIDKECCLNTPIGHAAHYNNFAAVKALVHAGAKITCKVIESAADSHPGMFFSHDR